MHKLRQPLTELSDTDRAIINRLQRGLPVVERPFEEVAAELGISEYVLIKRLQALLDDGVLSSFGPMYDSASPGGATRLAALAVPQARFDEVTRQVNALDEVAHNSRREHELNMWLVLVGDDEDHIASVIETIGRITGLKVYDFPVLEEYYVRSCLEV